MLICTGCDYVFDEDDADRFDPGTGETWQRCPVCHCDELDEAATCGSCGGDFSESDLEGGICHSCQVSAIKTYHTVMDPAFEALRGKLEASQLSYINNVLDELLSNTSPLASISA